MGQRVVDHNSVPEPSQAATSSTGMPEHAYDPQLPHQRQQPDSQGWHPQCAFPVASGLHRGWQPDAQQSLRHAGQSQATQSAWGARACFPGWQLVEGNMFPPQHGDGCTRFKIGNVVPHCIDRVPHEGMVTDSNGGRHKVVHKFTEFTSCGYHNMLCLMSFSMTSGDDMHVLFNGKFVGGSWFFRGSDELHVRFHHSGDHNNEVASCYTRMAGTDTWFHTNRDPRSILSKHINSF